MRELDKYFASHDHPQEAGSSLVELALLLPIFLVLLVGAVDIGRVYYVAIEVRAAAQAGAIYGIENPGDTIGMQDASLAGRSSLSGLSINATYGCECSDGSNTTAQCTAPPACSENYVNYVDVTATAPYSPLFSYPGVGSSMNVIRESRMRTGGD